MTAAMARAVVSVIGTAGGDFNRRYLKYSPRSAGAGGITDVLLSGSVRSNRWC